MQRPHETRGFKVIETFEGHATLLREYAIPEASRFIDGLVVANEASEAWGPVRPLIADRVVTIEHYSHPPAVPELSWAVAKHGWLMATWREPEQAGNTLRALLSAAGREPGLRRPPLLLVLCCGRPRKAIAAARELGLEPSEPGIWLAHRPVFGDIALIDVRGLDAERPGTSVLRLIATPRSSAESGAAIDWLLADPGVLNSTKKRLLEGLMNRNIPTANNEHESIVDRLRAEGRAEGEARGRAEGEARGRAEGEARGRLEQARAAVLRVLERRGLTVSDRDRRRIEQQTDLGRLTRWHEAAITAGSAADVLDLS